MTITVKITELTNIGANLASSTVVPVVNMAAPPVTQKTTIGNIANLVLQGAGVDYAEATVALLAQTVSNAAQPNITSVGTLTSLSVTGNATINGNITSNGTAYLGNISTTGDASITTLQVGTSANLGAVGNVTITGGSNGQVLTTNGSNVLSWTTVSGGGNGSPGGSNTQIQFNDAGAFGGNSSFTFNKTTGVFVAPFADVSGVANIVGGGATVAAKSLLNVASTFGSNDPQDPASAQAVRGRVTGANLTKTRNYVTGVTGQYLVTGTNASEFIKAGVLGVVGDQSTTADGAVVAYLDGDGGLTTANAAYAVSMKNSTPNSGFNYGLDLQFINLNLGGVTTSTFKQADIRFNNGVKLVANTAGNISINGNLMTSAEVVANGVIQSGTGFSTGGYLSVNGNTDLHDTTVTGNITANAFIGNGSQLTNIPSAGTSGEVQVNWLGSFSNQGGTPGDTYSTLQFDSNGMPTLDGTNAYQQRVDNSPYMQILAPRVESTDFGIVAGPGLTVVGYDDTYNTPRSAYLSVQDQANATQQWDFGILGNGDNNFVVSDRTNSNQWKFGTDGNLTIPGGLIGSGASPAPYISGFDSISSITVSASGNITGANISTGVITLTNGAVIKDTATAAIAFGDGAGANTQGAYSVAFGAGAGAEAQGNLAIAIGYNTGYQNQGLQSVAIGDNAGTNAQSNSAVAIGHSAGFTNQGDASIAIGQNAGNATQGNSAVAIGQYSGQTTQSDYSIAIGAEAGQTTQGDSSVAVGAGAGQTTQGVSAVAVGELAGQTTQGNNAVAIGYVAAYINQGNLAVAVGSSAGLQYQNDYAVAIGAGAGEDTQGINAVAIGVGAGQTTQGNSAVAIGDVAGLTNQGINAIAIGKAAGSTNQGNNSIILNATGVALNQTTSNTFTVAPVRNDVANIAEVVFYNTTSKEATYGNTLSVAGNITGAYILGNGSGLTSLPAPTVSQDISSNGAMSIMTYDGNLKYVNYATVEPSTGNIAGGNISTTGAVTANIANITTGNITTINSGLLQNGNSNITITSNGNVSIQAAGSTVELVVTSTGANITGTANITGNANVANIGATNGVFTGNISGNTNGFAIGYLNIPQVSAANATLALTDAGKHYYSTTAGNLTLTIPTNVNVAFATGTAVSIVVQAAGNILVNAASGVTLYMGGNSTAANRVVSGYGMATLMKVASDTWFINGAGVA
jgi:hypothetical protein